MTTSTGSTGARAIDRAAALLVAVVEDDRGWSLADLSAEVGLPRSTASRLVRALERSELVQRDARGDIRPGPVLVRYAWGGAGGSDLVAVAQPALERLADATGETVNLAVATPDGAEQVSQVDSRYLLGATNWLGRRVPYHASAVGKVLLAWGAVPLPSGPLERLAARTLTQRDALVDDLAAARRRGWAVAAEELEPGLVALAAPVLDAAGAVVAAVAVSGPALRLTPDRIDAVGAVLVAEAGGISARLGHRNRKEGAA